MQHMAFNDCAAS